MNTINILEEQAKINDAIRAISEARAKRQKNRHQKSGSHLVFRGQAIEISDSNSEICTAKNETYSESEPEPQILYH